MALAVYVSCPKSDHEWRCSPRSWSDHPGLYCLRCPSCGTGLKLAIEDGRMMPLPGWVGLALSDHVMTLTGDHRQA